MAFPIITKRHVQKWNTEFSWRIYYITIIWQDKNDNIWLSIPWQHLGTWKFVHSPNVFSSIIQLFLNIHFFENVLPLYVCMHRVSSRPLWKSEDNIRCPATAVAEDFETCGRLDQNPDLLQEQQMLLTLECPFLSLNAVFNFFSCCPCFPTRNFTNFPSNGV